MLTFNFKKYQLKDEGTMLDWAKSEDGFSVTRTYKGFKHIDLLVDENKKTRVA